MTEGVLTPKVAANRDDEKRTAVSVIIPVFNGEDRLPHVLNALAGQNEAERSFEVIVVDNGSSDGTAGVVEHDGAALRLAARGIVCRVVPESRRGLTYARIAGVRAARSPLVCLLDDDNLPEPDFLAKGIAAFADPGIGMVVSRVYPKWEQEPPPSIARRRHLLATNEYLGDEPIDFISSSRPVPTIGAGLWVRRAAFVAAVLSQDVDQLMSDRIGRELVSGGDIELGILFGRAAYRRVFDPSLRIAHAIPAQRLATAYICRLIQGIVRGELTLDRKYAGLTYGGRARVVASARLLVAALAIPWLPMVRSDGWREAAFIMADRWARVRGPQRSGVG